MIGANFKLGKLPARIDRRTLMLADYAAALPPAPDIWDPTSKLPKDLGVMLNDQIGCCTCAGIAHAIQAWTGEDGAIVTLPDPTVLRMYEQFCGYVQGDATTDKGGVILDVLNGWRKNPAIVDGHGLNAYVGIKPILLANVRQAIYYFGGIYAGIELPATAKQQSVWRFVPSAPESDRAPGSWGGHCVFIVAYNSTGPICVTWGGLLQMTWSFWIQYATEAYVLLSPDIVGSDDRSPIGLNIAQLNADLKRVTA